MLRDSIVLASTLTFTAIGFYFGTTVHGTGVLALMPTCAGTAGGFLLATAGCHMWERSRPKPARSSQRR